MKHRLRNSIIILLVTGVMLYLLLKDNFNSIMEVLTSVNPVWIIVAILIYLIYFVTDTIPFYIYSHNYNDKIRFPFMLYLNAITKFFNGITPLASGGQPMQLYVLHKDKVKYSDASTSVIQFYVIYQIALMIISSICLVYSLFLGYIDARPFALHMFIIGYIINMIILLFLIFVSFNKKFNKGVVRFIIKVLNLFGIVKDKEKTIEKWDKNCEGFYESAQLMKENKFVFFRGVVLQILQLICLFSVPLFVAYATGANHQLNMFNTIAISSFITICSCYVPIPGATGGVEYGFGAFFSKFIAKSDIRVVLILWRFITYFVPVIIGGIVFNIKEKE